ncbi:MAG: EsaB/YukD family protein [Bacillus sp. (in: firmicutes)]
MYIGITVDMKRYNGETVDLRLSDYLTIKKVIEIAWKIKKVDEMPNSGFWVRIRNKDIVCSGYESLVESGVTNGDHIEVL